MLRSPLAGAEMAESSDKKPYEAEKMPKKRRMTGISKVKEPENRMAQMASPFMSIDAVLTQCADESQTAPGAQCSSSPEAQGSPLVQDASPYGDLLGRLRQTIEENQTTLAERTMELSKLSSDRDELKHSLHCLEEKIEQTRASVKAQDEEFKLGCFSLGALAKSIAEEGTRFGMVCME
jgi:chromosome segregation ATPase